MKTPITACLTIQPCPPSAPRRSNISSIPVPSGKRAHLWRLTTRWPLHVTRAAWPVAVLVAANADQKRRAPLIPVTCACAAFPRRPVWLALTRPGLGPRQPGIGPVPGSRGREALVPEGVYATRAAHYSIPRQPRHNGPSSWCSGHRPRNRRSAHGPACHRSALNTAASACQGGMATTWLDSHVLIAGRLQRVGAESANRASLDPASSRSVNTWGTWVGRHSSENLTLMLLVLTAISVAFFVSAQRLRESSLCRADAGACAKSGLVAPLRLPETRQALVVSQTLPLRALPFTLFRAGAAMVRADVICRAGAQHRGYRCVWRCWPSGGMRAMRAC